MKPNVQANTIITNTKLLVICATLLQAGMAAAQTNPPAGSQEITRVGEQASSAGPAEYFTGRVRVDPVWPASQTINASGGRVTFERGARSAWHTHPAGQRLVLVSVWDLRKSGASRCRSCTPGTWCGARRA
jgi:hypothetical protein